MRNKFECCYRSVGGTFCYLANEDVINDCDDCNKNNDGLYCSWKLGNMEQMCNSCNMKGEC